MLNVFLSPFKGRSRLGILLPYQGMPGAMLLPPLWGKVGMGGVQIRYNNLFYSLNVAHYIMVPKSYNLETLGYKPLCPDMIIILLNSMLTTIKFKNQFLFKADKINNIFSDGGLSSKFMAHNLTATDMAPEFLFGVRQS
jgi:hypothetical protein